MSPKIGILLTNTGTPQAPTPQALKRYLEEFLSDPRVIHLPKIIWYPLLYGIILPTRSARSAVLYQKIWTKNSSPMRIYMDRIVTLLSTELECMQVDAKVLLGMNYGSPSILEAIQRFKQEKVQQLIVLPLFPQYSHTSTGSSYDRVQAALAETQLTGPIHKIYSYSDHADYVSSLASSIKKHWQTSGQINHLIISFHGIPKRYVEKGDPYQVECEKTAYSLARHLQLRREDWTLCYQSQFGYDRWLAPSLQNMLSALPKRGIPSIDIVCPGFAVDCLETLEEINIRGRELFFAQGGKLFNYIPALNDSPEQIRSLLSLIKPFLA